MKIPFFKLPKQAEKRNPIVGIIIGITISIVLGLCFHDNASKTRLSSIYDFIHSLEYRTYDLRFLIRGNLSQKYINKDIVLLDYDDETEEWLRFPPDRVVYTEVIKALSEKESRAKSTFYDIFFFDPFGQQLNTGMADIFQKTFANLSLAVSIDSEMTSHLKNKLYEAYEVLNNSKDTARTAKAAKILEDLLSREEITKTIEYFKKTIEFFDANQDVKDLASNRDVDLHDAISAAGNVFLAQIVNNEEPTPYDVDDIIFNPEVHRIFGRLIQMRDRSKTKTQMELDTNYALRNMTVDDFKRLLEDTKKKSIDGRKPLSFTKRERDAITIEYKKAEESAKKALEMNLKLGRSIASKDSVSEGDLLKNYLRLVSMHAPEKFIAEGAKGVGYVKPEFQKYDGTIRSATHGAIFQERLFFHIDVILAMNYLDVKPKDVVFYTDRVVLKNCKYPGKNKRETLTIPLFENKLVLINWAGRYYEPNQFTHRSYRLIYESAVRYNILKKKKRGEPLNTVDLQILASMTPKEIKKVKDDIEFFKGKISLTGLTAAGTHDLNPIPFHPRYPLVGMHANYLNMIINKLFIYTTPFWIFIIIMLFVGIFIGFIGGCKKQFPSAMISLGVGAGYFAVCVLLFNYARLWLPMMPVLITLIATYLLVLIYRFMTEGQEAKRMKSMFATYVNPSVVDTLIQHPEMLRLGGEKMDLTAMFALASGPGIKTEDAEVLVERLNEFFTVMTDQIFAHDGTLDKYEGSIIMAIYGAPVHFDDHPKKACLSCADMKKALQELCNKWKADGKEPIHITVGLNSGPMIAGNMGSKSRFNYTIMGDSVNLAARILGASRQYGISFMVSETTYERAKDAIVGRLVDNIVVVGKEEAANVYEIVAAANDTLSESLKEFLESYKKAFTLYQNRQWDEAIELFEKALKCNPEDQPSKMLIERCQQYKISPPREGWKGEYVLTSKGL